MNKTVRLSGLQKLLDKLQPFLKSITSNSTVQLADGITLHVPDESTLGFAETGNPDVIEVTFAGLKAEIDRRAFFGLIPIRGTEPVTYADVGPTSVQTQVSVCRITAVDDGGGS